MSTARWILEHPTEGRGTISVEGCDIVVERGGCAPRPHRVLDADVAIDVAKGFLRDLKSWGYRVLEATIDGAPQRIVPPATGRGAAKLDAQWEAVGVDASTLDELVIDCDELDDPVRLRSLLADPRLDQTTSIHLMRWYVDGGIDYRPWLKALAQRTFPAVTSLSIGYFGSVEFEHAKVGTLSAELWERFPLLEALDMSGVFGKIEPLRPSSLKSLLVYAAPLSSSNARALAESDLSALESLELDATWCVDATVPLATLEGFFRRKSPALRVLKLAGFAARGALGELFSAPWFEQLEHVQLMGLDPTDADRAALARASEALLGVPRLQLSRVLVSDALKAHPGLEVVER